MSHRAEPRVRGRHRASHNRHRAPRRLATERGRTVALTATLGAALVTGVAGGSAAAAGSNNHPTALSDPAAPTTAAGPSTTVAGRDDFPAAPAGAAAVHRKSRPAVAPLEASGGDWVNPIPTAQVTSCFGPRWGRVHEGVDLAAPDDTPIVAAGAGVVVRAGVAEGYGNAVLIDHGNGYLTHYGHLSAIAVGVGQHVTAGEQIGNEGSTGHSTGPHLHFEVHQGRYQNPIEPTRWMHDHGVDIPGCAAL